MRLPSSHDVQCLLAHAVASKLHGHRKALPFACWPVRTSMYIYNEIDYLLS